MSFRISRFTDEHKVEVETLHKNFGKKVTPATATAAAASFLVIASLIVIVCGCLCLTLPGVNVISNVIFHAVLPGFGGILLSLPLIILTVKYNREKNHARELMINRMVVLLGEYKVPEADRKERAKFILEHFLNWEKTTDATTSSKKQSRDSVDKSELTDNSESSSSDDSSESSLGLKQNEDVTKLYQGKIPQDIKKKIGRKKRDRNYGQERMVKGLDEAITKINNPKKNK